MWKIERPPPKDKFRSTIFTNKKNLSGQTKNANLTGKRWKKDIIDQNSYIFAWDKPKYDRSLVVAPTKKQRVERYIQSHKDNHKQRSTIFSTPTVLNKLSNYKSLDSKKHYSNIQNSSNMQGVLDYGFGNTSKKEKAGRRKNNVHKNACSVGNPITFQGVKDAKHEPKFMGKKKGKFSKDLFSTTGNFMPEKSGQQVKEFKGGNVKPNKKWADQMAKNPFRKNKKTVRGITRDLLKSTGR